MIKRKFKLEINKIYSPRKLRNIPLEEFQSLILNEFKQKFTESEFNFIIKYNKLLASYLCEGYKYEQSDLFTLVEAARLLKVKIPLYIRKNIDVYEKAQQIKTMWYELCGRNVRSQNFKFDSYE
jgi:hypothetical protein